MKMFQMKMAKPSPADIKAAEDLLHIFNLIDARFGGPWSTPGAGDSLHDLLEGGEEEFDCEDDTHLKTLYNNLASLLRTAPSFYARVISGMCHVVMNEQNQLLDPDSDCIDLHPRFAQLGEEANLVRQIDSLRIELIPSYDAGYTALAYGESDQPIAEAAGMNAREAITELVRLNPHLAAYQGV
ncbi:hypothetical protein [Metapseudomonas otitidis]|uniref:hypothetical protein n=1 Tax=Metapseudomonas otitidis TaxID=319939 RepID=UPI00209B53E0|nr:hypothetical protein [Pseudomonas otitidis]MCO7557484.1 hypothetical protein [Pseudomonas otitidis]